MDGMEKTPRVSHTADTILIADDDGINRAILGNIFEQDYHIQEVGNGRAALELLAAPTHSICALLLDVVMPEMDGLEVLTRLNELGLTQKIPVFLITAKSDNATLKTAYSLGAMDVIHKPIIPFIVERRVNSVVELFRARERLDEQVRAQQTEINWQERRIADLNEGMIEALATSIEFRNGESGEHVHRIRVITEYLLTHTRLGVGLDKDTIRQIGLAAALHDVGKIAIPDNILNKPARLTPEEFTVMKTHTTAGARLLQDIPQMKWHASYSYAVDIAMHHHERWDGNGYPNGLKGEDISAWAQVVSIADVYDALVSPRVYKDPIPPDKAIDMIQDGACGVFNPALVDCFLTMEPRFRPIYRKD